MPELKQLFTELQTPKRIVLIAHSRPDGDAIGSCLALKYYFEKKGHTADVIAPDEFPDFLNWMKDSDKIYIYLKKSKTCFAILTQANYIFCCDFNALKRIEQIGDDILKMHRAKIVMIDHHRDPEHFADYELWDHDASSTCELVYDFILQAGDKSLLDTDIASNIYAGIAMDTGVFQYSNTSAKVHAIAGALMEYGINIEQIHNDVYNQYGENRMRFIGYLLSEKLEILNEYKAAFMTITMKEAEEYKLSVGDKEGIVNLPLAMRDVQMAVLFTEDKDKIKISFRSKGEIRVDTFAKQYFNGGGHKNAAGGSTRSSLPDTIELLKKALPEFLNIKS
ncbi:MAG: bifunctional oligoribonuclease/PAP phosphatase NrnA [Fimbriimonadaceae bacterium]|nr:bifunctional oligoribonuclease/PAP phosphatase NrnA [Chitinophagales bacterium]